MVRRRPHLIQKRGCCCCCCGESSGGGRIRLVCVWKKNATSVLPVRDRMTTTIGPVDFLLLFRLVVPHPHTPRTLAGNSSGILVVPIRSGRRCRRHQPSGGGGGGSGQIGVRIGHWVVMMGMIVWQSIRTTEVAAIIIIIIIISSSISVVTKEQSIVVVFVVDNSIIVDVDVVGMEQRRRGRNTCRRRHCHCRAQAVAGRGGNWHSSSLSDLRHCQRRRIVRRMVLVALERRIRWTVTTATAIVVVVVAAAAVVGLCVVLEQSHTRGGRRTAVGPSE